MKHLGAVSMGALGGMGDTIYEIGASWRIRRVLMGVYCVPMLWAAAIALGSELRAQDSLGRQSSPMARALRISDAISGIPIPGALVIDLANGRRMVTTRAGIAILNMAHADRVLVEVRKIGYSPGVGIVSLRDTGFATISLSPIRGLPTVISSGKFNIIEDLGLRSGFGFRCRAVHVTCVDSTDMMDPGVRTIGDYIKRADGIENGLLMHGLLGGKCVPIFYVDGFLWDTKDLGFPIGLPDAPGSSAPFTPSNVHGVEVYAPTTARPGRFHGSGNCGSVVIWTK